MAKLNFIARADDLGSSDSANRAIDRVTKAGFIKNVSVMAPGPNVEAAAGVLAGRGDICFGMHTTLNAEWDNVKWAPILPLGANSGLVDKNGDFLADPSLFAETKPAVETIMREVSAQLDRLHNLGFDIRYIDSHMFPELYVDGLDQAMGEFAKKKGLLDHMYYYAVPPGLEQLQKEPEKLAPFLRALPAGQYFLVAHPSLDTDEMRQTGNARHSGADIAKARAAETDMFSKKALLRALGLLGVRSLRYDEAKPLAKRLTVEDARALLAQL